MKILQLEYTAIFGKYLYVYGSIGEMKAKLVYNVIK